MQPYVPQSVFKECNRLQDAYQIQGSIIEATVNVAPDTPVYRPPVPGPAIPTIEKQKAEAPDPRPKEPEIRPPVVPSQPLIKQKEEAKTEPIEIDLDVAMDLLNGALYFDAQPLFQNALLANPDMILCYIALLVCNTKIGSRLTMNSLKPTNRECAIIHRAIQLIGNGQHALASDVIDEGHQEIQTLSTAMLFVKAWAHLQLGNTRRVQELLSKLEKATAKLTFRRILAEEIFDKQFDAALQEYNCCGDDSLDYAIAAAKLSVKNPKGIVLAFLACSRNENYVPLTEVAPLVLNSVYNQTFESVFKDLFEAIKLFADQKTQPAKQAMSRLVQSYSDNPWLLYLQAWFISKSNANNDVVIDITNNIMTIDAKFYLALHLQSRVLRSEGRKAEAVRVTDKLLKINNNFLPAWFNKAKWVEDTDKQAALQAYDKVLEINSTYKLAVVGKVRLLMKLNRSINEVASLMGKLGDLNEYADYYGEYIQYLESRHDNKELLAALNNGPSSIVRTPEMLYKKAKLLFDDGRHDAASRAIDEAVAKSPHNLELLRLKAKVHDECNNNSAALSAVDRILQINKNDKEALLLKLKIMERQDDDEGALAALDQLIQMEPRNEELLLKKALKCNNTGQNAQGYAASKTLTQLDPNCGSYWALLAIMAAKVDKMVDARDAATKARRMGCHNALVGPLNSVIDILNEETRQQQRQTQSSRNNNRGVRRAKVVKFWLRTESDEITVLPGEIVAVIETGRAWALVRDSQGNQGAVPLSCLEIEGGNDDEELTEAQKTLLGLLLLQSLSK